jgi:hypothetical protein
MPSESTTSQGLEGGLYSISAVPTEATGEKNVCCISSFTSDDRSGAMGDLGTGIDDSLMKGPGGEGEEISHKGIGRDSVSLLCTTLREILQYRYYYFVPLSPCFRCRIVGGIISNNPLRIQTFVNRAIVIVCSFSELRR